MLAWEKLAPPRPPKPGSAWWSFKDVVKICEIFGILIYSRRIKKISHFLVYIQTGSVILIWTGARCKTGILFIIDEISQPQRYKVNPFPTATKDHFQEQKKSTGLVSIVLSLKYGFITELAIVCGISPIHGKTHRQIPCNTDAKHATGLVSYI